MNGKKLALLRKKKRISQEKLAKELNVSRSTVAMWEINSNEPDNETIVKIATFLEVTTDFLLDKNEQEEKPIRQDEPLKENTIIFHRNGETITKEFSHEQMELITKLIEEIPSSSKN